jgi:hypothetical protein
MSLALDGLLDEEGQQNLERHVATCATCRLEWQAMQQASALFQESPLVGPPLGFAIRVDRRLAERAQKRRRLFGGVAVVTSSLSLAGVTLAVVMVIALTLIAWRSFGSLPALQQGTSAVSQVASGVGLMGRGASFFIGDLLLRFGPPLVLVLGVGLVVLVGLWVWLLIRRSGGHHHNGYA